MYRLIALLLLSACVAAPKTVVVGRYRAPDAPMYSNAVMDQNRLVGTWSQVAAFGGEGCKPGGAEISRGAGGLQIRYRLCESGVQMAAAGTMASETVGRFAVPGQPGPWWILWADGDYRTLVVGSPNGRLGFILNRGPFPPDRLKAARDIFEWNGYDPRGLVVY
ncbi:lipocalin family protein [Cypionkella sp.]|uniref:lipocalin family protein n=1 Tax=Cypionkella sp. TaxID=2811411 RepID=UPI002723D284|nr:lipocalin family protein [Cypionkella sp.]MDO8984286.1 lipocalin family protein [Cypionkella sp.]MDP2047960.1 lipocalin family protein [Cypionkella sp.]